MPWLARQSKNAGPAFCIDGAVQAVGVVMVAWPAALTVPLERTQAPGWPGRSSAPRLKVLWFGWALCNSDTPSSEAIGMTVWLAGIRFGRIHSGMATWTAAKMARVTAMAGTV